MQNKFATHKSAKNEEFEELAGKYLDTMQDELRKFLKSLKVQRYYAHLVIYQFL